jgi:tellurite methyltransferase
MSYVNYDTIYTENRQYFGEHPENLLKDYYSLCDKRGRILDIGIGQGRNARFLLKYGYGVDGIDSSKVAIDDLNKEVKKESLDLKLFNMSFEDFSCPQRTYSGILIFGLFPILSKEQITDLARKARRWLKKGGIVFVTGFSTKETLFRPQTSDWEEVTENSFTDNKGNYRTFIDIQEAISKFRRFKTTYKWEGLGKAHKHGSDQLEQHHIYEFILQKI